MSHPTREEWAALIVAAKMHDLDLGDVFARAAMIAPLQLTIALVVRPKRRRLPRILLGIDPQRDYREVWLSFLRWIVPLINEDAAAQEGRPPNTRRLLDFYEFGQDLSPAFAAAKKSLGPLIARDIEYYARDRTRRHAVRKELERLFCLNLR